MGGATIPLFLTDAGAVPPRVTFDVDVVVDLRNRGELYRLEERLREAGFGQPVEGPIRRWTIDDVPVDFMPVDTDILGFTNRWFGELVRPCAGAARQKARIPRGRPNKGSLPAAPAAVPHRHYPVRVRCRVTERAAHATPARVTAMAACDAAR